MSLRARLSSYWCAFQAQLFPAIEEDLGPLGERYQFFITVLEFVRVEQHLPCFHGLRGRPQQDRAAMARAFMAKAVFEIATTRALLERLANDRALRRLCGWESIRAIPSEATFSRAFSEFAEGALPSLLHQAVIADTMQGSAGRSCVTRCDRDRGARASDAKAKAASQAEAQARATAQGRGTAQGTEPSAASAADDAAGDA